MKVSVATEIRRGPTEWKAEVAATAPLRLIISLKKQPYAGARARQLPAQMWNMGCSAVGSTTRLQNP
jgi:hypothetical protein